LFDRGHELAAVARPELAVITPEIAGGSSSIGSGAAARVRVFDAAAQLLRHASSSAPLVVVLDDLHWADRSSIDLLRFLAHRPEAGALMLVGAYRPDELEAGIHATLTDLATSAELVPLRGLSAGEVADLVRAVIGAPVQDHAIQDHVVQDHWARLVHERSGGHPFYARELCRLLATTGSATDVPAAVRAVIGRRLSHLSRGCATLLDGAAVAGSTLQLDVLAEVTGNDTTQIAMLTSSRDRRPAVCYRAT
jgi:predicted ATPase